MALCSGKSMIAASVASSRHVLPIPAVMAGPRPAPSVWSNSSNSSGGVAARPQPRPLHQLAPCAANPSPAAPSAYVVGGDGDAELAAFQQHQQSAPRPSAAEEARTVLDQGKHAVLCTLSSGADTQGFPASSVVEYACDGTGRPFFATSTLSAHTADMLADGRVSLTVKSPSFQGMDCGRLTLQGTVSLVSEEDKARLREIYLKKYPSAFYVDFPDFKWFRMESIAAARFNGGFGRAPRLTVDEYLAAKPDPVYPFSGPVCGHMNVDHDADSKAMIKHYVGLTVDAVTMLDLDRLGINCSVKRGGQTFKLRLPFPHPAEDRKSIKDAIVEMTKKARSAAATNARTPGGTL
ncbi:hypothetical protein PLESTB_000775700 [Pleodorina starrii]|uniref:DUF2470 domain-containing protein n=1 Tax=Pleodorina starrii TaxID=330485 RepID=A0A9W6BKZ5_9CHLO|nr:hypothetical protein PLESTM_000508800 [Pleodorina starrii]GLC53680.1 hypothetical protein PLESTB_000775700 [Pleodorina starrii]GLC72863.1 hypothetical protein PLESTF_001303600 [Pleodorina starrii]